MPEATPLREAAERLGERLVGAGLWALTGALGGVPRCLVAREQR